MVLCKCGDMSRYKCPRCGEFYCSMSCYKIHGDCPEYFYQEQVEMELRGRKVGQDDRNQMLKYLRREAARPDLSVEGCGAEVEVAQPGEERDTDLSQLLADVHLRSDDELWAMLSPEEQRAFQKSITSGSILEILPRQRPWWLNDHRDNIRIATTTTPKIPPLRELYTGPISDYLVFNVLHVVLAYVTCDMVHVGGVTSESESGECLLALLGLRSAGRTVVTSVGGAVMVLQTALESTDILGHISLRTILLNTAHIFQGGVPFLQRCLRETDTVARRLSRNQGLSKSDRQDVRKFRRKLEFYHSWTESEYCIPVVLEGVRVELEKRVPQLKACRKDGSKMERGPRSCKSKLIEEL